MLNWIISSSVLIIVIAGLRFFLKGKISLRLQYALWLLVLVRLLVPFSVGETSISVGNWMTQISQREEVNKVYELSQSKLPSMTYEQAYVEVAEQYKSQGIDINTMSDAEFSEKVEAEVLETMESDITLRDLAMFFWGFGLVFVGFWFVFTNVRFQRRLLASRKPLNVEAMPSVVELQKEKKLPVFISDEVDTPCLFGLVRPVIYVTSGVAKDEEVLRHVIAHETTHYIHKDHLWGYLRALCLAIHWYNPLVWCAAILSRNDAELACDESTIKRLGESERASYGHTLIDLTCEKRPAVLLAATTMTGSGKSIKERIALIAKKPQTVVVALVVVVLIAIVAMLITFTGGNNTGNTDVPATNVQDTEILEIDSTELESSKLEMVQFTKEEIELISKFLLASTGAMIGDPENPTEAGNVWGGSSAEITDYYKSIIFQVLIDKYDYSGLDSFEEAGLLEEVEGAYRTDAEKYVVAMRYMFQGGLSDESNAMSFYIDNNGELRVPVDENGVYEINACLESVFGNVTNLIITQMSEDMLSFDADVDSLIGLMGADFDIHMEAILNEESPLAGITITSIQVTCKEQMNYVHNDSEEYHIIYEELPQESLVTDETIIKRVLGLLLDEMKLTNVIVSECRTDDEQEIEEDGRLYYRVLDADNWSYYEEQAKQYYSERYLKEEFTGKYLEETKLYVEKDGKLYRALADSSVGALIEDSIEIWEKENGTYYVTIAENTVDGSGYLRGYEVKLAEGSVYGFEIVDKLLVFSQRQDRW